MMYNDEILFIYDTRDGFGRVKTVKVTMHTQAKWLQNASIKLMNECLVRKSFTFGSWSVIHADHCIHPPRADCLSTALAFSTCSVTPHISSILSPFKRTSFLVDLSFPFTEFLARNNNINHVSFTNVNNLSCTTIIALLTRLRGLALDIKAEKTTCMASCSSTILLHTWWPTLILLQSQGMLYVLFLFISNELTQRLIEWSKA